jgi:hypothetical protein
MRRAGASVGHGLAWQPEPRQRVHHCHRRDTHLPVCSSKWCSSGGRSRCCMVRMSDREGIILYVLQRPLTDMRCQVRRALMLSAKTWRC